MSRIKDGLFWLFLVAFAVSPWVEWGFILTGRIDMSAPFNDPYVPSDASPEEYRLAAYTIVSVWTLLALGVTYLIVDALRRTWHERRRR